MKSYFSKKMRKFEKIFLLNVLFVLYRILQPSNRT
jgi:hypothetical protein